MAYLPFNYKAEDSGAGPVALKLGSPKFSRSKKTEIVIFELLDILNLFLVNL